MAALYPDWPGRRDSARMLAKQTSFRQVVVAIDVSVNKIVILKRRLHR